MTQRATDFNPTVSKLLCSVFEVKMRSGSFPLKLYVVLKKADELVTSREMAVM